MTAAGDPSIDSDALKIAPRGDDHHRSNDHHQQHESEADTVQSERVVRPEWLDPRRLLDQLHAAADLELGGDDESERERDQRYRQRHMLGGLDT